MKSIKTSILLFNLFAAVLLSSCIDPVDLGNQVNEKPQLVLYCRLCPQLDSTYIMLSHTQLLYGAGSHQEITMLRDGVVELSADGEHWIQATYYEPKDVFLLTRQEFPVEEGHTYYIRASRAGYDDVSAVCTVPYSRPVDAHFDTVVVNNDVHWGEIWDEPHKDIYVEWRDYPGEANYYALTTYSRYTHFFHDYETGESSESYYWSYFVSWLVDGNSSLQYFSDEGRDGEVFRYIEEELVDLDEESGENEEYAQYYMMFLDKNCYQYEVTLSEEGGFFNGFLLEPMHTYSNIEHGFGLFGAFTLQEIP